MSWLNDGSNCRPYASRLFRTSFFFICLVRGNVRRQIGPNKDSPGPLYSQTPDGGTDQTVVIAFRRRCLHTLCWRKHEGQNQCLLRPGCIYLHPSHQLSLSLVPGNSVKRQLTVLCPGGLLEPGTSPPNSTTISRACFLQTSSATA